MFTIRYTKPKSNIILHTIVRSEERMDTYLSLIQEGYKVLSILPFEG